MSFDVRGFTTLASAHELIDDFLPQMQALAERPHIDHSGQWFALRERLDVIFTDAGWGGDESRVAFDLLVAFSERTPDDRT